MDKARVFIDTNVLLKAFPHYREYLSGKKTVDQLPTYLTDKDVKRFTFEKCIYESYLAFRGIGGKKPDEGRGDWADRLLKSSSDPKSVAKLISKFHGDNKAYAHFWINQIGEFVDRDIDFAHEEKIEELAQHYEKIEELLQQKYYFENLCNEFNGMLVFSEIKVLYYVEVFSCERNETFVSHHLPSSLDSFIRETTIPSEDFEIIYSAKRIEADIFITDDKRLMICAASLGLNSSFGPAAFCNSKDYELKKKQWQDGNLYAEMK